MDGNNRRNADVLAVLRNRPRRVAAALILVILASIGPAMGTGASAAAAPVVVSDSSADRSRTFADDDSGNIFSIAFLTTVPGEDRRIHGVIVATVGSIDDDIMLASVTLKCWGPGESEPTSAFDYPHVLNQQRNVLRNETSTMSLRWTYRAATPGTHRCVIFFDTVRPRPTSGVDPLDQAVLVDNGSSLSATGPLPVGTDQVRVASSATEVLWSSNPAQNIMNRVWTAPSTVTQIAVNGDFMVTSCTSLADSCPNEAIDRDGGMVRAILYVKQYNTAGDGYCQVTSATPGGGSDQFVSRDRHHETLRTGVSVPVSTAPDCSRNFRIYVALSWVSGSGIKIHSYAAVSAVLW